MPEFVMKDLGERRVTHRTSGGETQDSFYQDMREGPQNHSDSIMIITKVQRRKLCINLILYGCSILWMLVTITIFPWAKD